MRAPLAGREIARLMPVPVIACPCVAFPPSHPLLLASTWLVAPLRACRVISHVSQSMRKTHLPPVSLRRSLFFSCSCSWACTSMPITPNSSIHNRSLHNIDR
jgi:hypothetical protein